MNFKMCPACDKGKLFFNSYPMTQHDDVVVVTAACNSCGYIFLHHFPFDDMLAEVMIEVTSEDSDRRLSKRRGNLRLIKS